MPRTITYEILDQPDGRFTVSAHMPPDRTYRRDHLATLAEAEAWIDGLRVLMAACGAPVVQAEHPATGVAMAARDVHTISSDRQEPTALAPRWISDHGAE